MENSQLAHIENEIAMKNAINDVTKNGLAIRLAATKFGVSKSALHRKVLQYKTFSGESQNFNFKSVFTIGEENLLSEYLLQASRMCYELTLKDTQELAYYEKQASRMCYELTLKDTQELAHRYAIANEKHIPQLQTKWQELSGFIYLQSDTLT
ncbi:CENP-B N-terminal DNA-binding domain [Popillia japonica]|uniref:CENP-B N-terminal DNA-binding domain n=1 Tax=Popillia japonica TaxID=7064 RepID=A0AAW1M0J2_POPJA